MKFNSIQGAIAALEQFEEEVAEAVVTPTQDESIADDERGEVLERESAAIDTDADNMAKRTEGVGNVIDMAERADVEEDEPLPDAVQTGVEIALESMGLGLEADDPAKETKKTMLDRLKAFFAGLLRMAKEFCARMVKFAKSVYAYATDRSARNKRRAEKFKEEISGATFTRKKTKEGESDADVASGLFSDRLSKAMARPSGMGILQCADNVLEYVKNQNRAIGRGLMLDATVILSEIAEKPSNFESKQSQFHDLLSRIGDAAGTRASAEQAKAADQDTSEVTVTVSGAFFGGHRGWVAVPKSYEKAGKFNHGLGVLDNIKHEPLKTILDKDDLQTLADYVIKIDGVINDYRTHVSELDKIEEKLKMMAARATDRVGDFKEGSLKYNLLKETTTQMNQALPKIVKGPQVAAVKYASEVATMLMVYIDAASKAYDIKSAKK